MLMQLRRKKKERKEGKGNRGGSEKGKQKKTLASFPDALANRLLGLCLTGQGKGGRRGKNLGVKGNWSPCDQFDCYFGNRPSEKKEKKKKGVFLRKGRGKGRKREGLYYIAPYTFLTAPACEILQGGGEIEEREEEKEKKRRRKRVDNGEIYISQIFSASLNI